MASPQPSFLGLSERTLKCVQMFFGIVLALCIILGIGAYTSGTLADPREPWFSIAVLVGLGAIGLIFNTGLMMAFAKLAANRGR